MIRGQLEYLTPGLISPTTGGKARKRNMLLVGAAVIGIALVLVLSLSARHNKRAVTEAINEVKRDSGATERLTQPRQPRVGSDYDEVVGEGESDKERVKLEDTVYGKFIPTGFNGTWVSGNEVKTFCSLLHDIFNQNTKIISDRVH